MGSDDVRRRHEGLIRYDAEVEPQPAVGVVDALELAAAEVVYGPRITEEWAQVQVVRDSTGWKGTGPRRPGVEKIASPIVPPAESPIDGHGAEIYPARNADAPPVPGDPTMNANLRSGSEAGQPSADRRPARPAL